MAYKYHLLSPFYTMLGIFHLSIHNKEAADLSGSQAQAISTPPCCPHEKLGSLEAALGSPRTEAPAPLTGELSKSLTP